MTYKEFFSNKKIAVIGLGPHGEMMADIKFLLRSKANVFFYDIRSERRLKNFLIELKDYGLGGYTCGKVFDDELLNFDLIILSPEISKKSLFLKKATQAEIQIEYPETLFFKLSPPITLIGVLGLYGKTMVSNILHQILKKLFISNKEQSLFFMDPDSLSGALTHLKKVKKGDVVLSRIPEYLMTHYYDIHISPHVAILTSPIDFSVLNFQTYNNFIVAPDSVVDLIKSQNNFSSRAKILRTRPSLIPKDWDIDNRNIHEKENIALIIQASELFKISLDEIKEFIKGFSGMKGCIEFVKKVNQIEFYNDAHSITPESTINALKSLEKSVGDITLIMGGAYTGYDYSDLLKYISESERVNTIVLLPGSGTSCIRLEIDQMANKRVIQALTLEDALREAYKASNKGDKVLFSPAFDAIGVDISRKERGEKFIKLVRGL